MLKRFWGVFLLFGLLVACTEDVDDPKLEPLPSEDSTTVLAYLIADNDLNKPLAFNVAIMYIGLAEMEEPATLLIYWDGKTAIGENNSKHLILKYETDGKGRINGKKALDLADFNNNDKYNDAVFDEAIILKEYDEQVCTDKNVMAEVLQDMVSFSPTEKIGLIVGSHGSAWFGGIGTNARALGYDGYTSNSINIPDMVEAVESTCKHLEFILFDACFMGTAEVAYEFRHVADYQISSVMEVPAYGFPYNYFMKYLYEDTVEGYQKVCQSFVNYYQVLYDLGDIAWGTIALIDSWEIDNMTQSIRQELISHKDVLANYDPRKIQEYGRSSIFSRIGFAADLEHFVKDLNGGEVPVAFKEQLDKTVLYKGCIEKARYHSYNYNVDASNFCGLGIYIPREDRKYWNNEFKTLDWYEASGWNEVTFSWGF